MLEWQRIAGRTNCSIDKSAQTSSLRDNRIRGDSTACSVARRGNSLRKIREAIRHGFVNYARIDGRANRRDFWIWLLFAVIITGLCNYADGAYVAPARGFLPHEEGAGQPLSIIALIAFGIPTFTVTIRRLHDVNWSGKWVWLAVLPLVLVLSYPTILPMFAEQIYEYGLIGLFTPKAVQLGFAELYVSYSHMPLLLTGFVLILCGMKGDKGPNRFGDG